MWLKSLNMRWCGFVFLVFMQDVPQSLLYVKIFTAGHEVPSDETILSFKHAVHRFLQENQDNGERRAEHGKLSTHGQQGAALKENKRIIMKELYICFINKIALPIYGSFPKLIMSWEYLFP